jgi:hypothetical protein
MFRVAALFASTLIVLAAAHSEAAARKEDRGRQGASARSAPSRAMAPRQSRAQFAPRRAARISQPSARVQRYSRAPQRQRLEQRAQRRHERIQQRAQRREQIIQQRNAKNQQLQDMRAQQRQQRLQQGQQQQQAIGRDGKARVTQQQARQGRFAAQIQNRQANWSGRRAWGSRHAWRRGHRAVFVPWFGALFWPYAYSDLFDYTFWPYGYDPAYWAYAYDDFFDGIFFPDGAPYVDYVYEGPYQGGYALRRDRSARETTGSVSSGAGATPGRVSQAARELCAEPAKGVTAWPFERIEQAVAPNAEQRALLDDLKNAAAQAAERLKQACPENLPMTPPGRLQAMTLRLQATLDAVKLVRPPLDKFYTSLSDEQKARFNAIGPDLGKDQRTARSETQSQQADCGGEKAGLTALPIERIEEVVQPSVAQAGALDRLSEAMDKAVQVLQSACPTTIAQTPVGRLEVMQKRLEAMIEAANTVRPALEDFYASLNNEQKAKFNRLGRDSARRG